MASEAPDSNSNGKADIRAFIRVLAVVLGSGTSGAAIYGLGTGRSEDKVEKVSLRLLTLENEFGHLKTEFVRRGDELEKERQYRERVEALLGTKSEKAAIEHEEFRRRLDRCESNLGMVAHPPCARWCAMAKFVESQRPDLKVGCDGGTFAAALAIVRAWGGVLEHPAWSRAWPAHGLLQPAAFGWTRDMWRPNEWVCEVSQSAYGHRARKQTWLFYVGKEPPFPLRWDSPEAVAVVGFLSHRGGGSPFQSKKTRLRTHESSATPLAFRDVLLELARRARG